MQAAGSSRVGDKTDTPPLQRRHSALLCQLFGCKTIDKMFCVVNFENLPWRKPALFSSHNSNNASLTFLNDRNAYDVPMPREVF